MAHQEETHENPETELVNYAEESSKDPQKMDESYENSSPRGVLETPVTGSDSDHSSSSRSNSFSSSSEEKTGDDKNCSSALSSTLDVMNAAVQWKNIFENIRKKSVKRLTSTALLNYCDQSKKSLRWKFGWNQVSEDSFDCGEWMAPKPSWRNFSYQELEAATKSFSPDKLLGKGGHAEVYKGCLPDGQVVAVKKITKKNKKDEDRVGEFLSELGIIAHINHPNAAKLIGFGSESGLHLVLQFAPYGSLASLLHGSTDCLDWNIRFKVAVGVADGLKYLHSDCQRRIIHRDITASNILLADDYQPQISDFGLAKWLPEKWVHHVVSPIEGTFGYMAPEYFMHGVIHEKTDVFAFGVLLLELITGRRAVDSCRQSLVMWAKPLLENNSIKELADPRLGNEYDIVDMNRAILAASICVHHLPDMRPNMTRVVQILRGESGAVETKQKSMGSGRTILVDACDIQDYTCTTYLKDLDRHKELVMQ